MSMRNLLLAAAVIATVVWLPGCSMKEEMRRIDEVNRAHSAFQASRSSNLTGEQLFLRSCNTCHPGGRKGPEGPTLINMDKDFPGDEALAAYIRKGKGIMPAQPVSVMNDTEMGSLISYLRVLNVDLHDAEQKEKEADQRRAEQKIKDAQEKLNNPPQRKQRKHR